MLSVSKRRIMSDHQLDRIERKVNRIGNLMVFLSAIVAAFFVHEAIVWLWPFLQLPALAAAALVALLFLLLRPPFRA
jgi:hypothetical protein